MFSFVVITLVICLPLAFGKGTAQNLLFHVKGSENMSIADFKSSSLEGMRCRFSDEIYKTPLDFRYFSCGYCYEYLNEIFFKKGEKLVFDGSTYPYLWLNNTGVVPNISDASSPVWGTFLSKELSALWRHCCEAAESCCEVMKASTDYTKGAHCPRTWDGWGCWPDTPNNTVVEIECPTYVYHHGEVPVCTHYAFKNCTSEGTWYRNFMNHEWTNYSVCSQRQDIKAIQQMHIISFGVSISLLVPAMLIFICYKQLHVFRVLMHRNLFISLALEAVFVIVFETYYLKEHLASTGVSRLEQNSIPCKAFYSVTKYLRITAYTWMLCEGLYLHKLITAAFAEQKNMLKFYLIGWGIPLIPVSIWIYLRQANPEADNACWTMPYKEYEWTLNVTMLLTLVINLCLLTNIIRVIVTKLRTIRTSESTQFKRAVRATVVLIPLFGLHFFFILYHPKSSSCSLTKFLGFFTYALDGLQGAIVAVLFCYLNQEVINLIMRSYKRRKLVSSVASRISTRRMISRDSRLSLSTNAVILSDSMSIKRTSK